MTASAGSSREAWRIQDLASSSRSGARMPRRREAEPITGWRVECTGGGGQMREGGAARRPLPTDRWILARNDVAEAAMDRLRGGLPAASARGGPRARRDRVRHGRGGEPHRELVPAGGDEDGLHRAGRPEGAGARRALTRRTAVERRWNMPRSELKLRHTRTVHEDGEDHHSPPNR